MIAYSELLVYPEKDMGRPKGSMHSEKSRKAISDSLKRAYRSGRRQPAKGMAGKRHKPETIEKMRATAALRIADGSATNLFVPGHQRTLGEVHPGFKGDAAGYVAIHAWVARRLGRPKNCEHCEATENLDWANKSGEYLRDLDDWIGLCRSCHMKYDRENNIWKHPRFV